MRLDFHSVLILVSSILSPLAFAADASEGSFTPPPMEVPEGFEVVLAAGPPLVHHPMMGGLDDRGRLFISESDGVNRKDEELAVANPHKILMLEDTDDDGVFDKRTVFADHMTLPNGALWHDGALYVCSPPGLWKLEDLDDDGVADKRTHLTGKFGFNGMSCDLHGPFLSPSGRLFIAGGQHNYEFPAPEEGAEPLRGQTSGIFSCKTDGSDPIVHLAGGMDNPVEVTFTPEGEVLGTVNLFHDSPRHDCLMHWLYGGVYPKRSREARLTQFKRTGDLMPFTTSLGHVAVSGLSNYRSEAFGEGFRDNLFIALFNTQTIVRLEVEPDGSTYRTTESDFLVGDNADSHLTDVFEDADGSLLFIDTGGWYRFGCPSSGEAKPDVLGAVYRIRKKDASPIEEPRGRNVDWQNASNPDLVASLDDPRFTVRDLALVECGRRGDAIVPALETALEKENLRTRRNAVWALSRVESERARAAIRKALADSELSVRRAAIRSVIYSRDALAVDALIRVLSDDEASARRAAATALGRIGDARAVPTLLEGLAAPIDRELEHAYIFALIEIADPEGVRQGLASDNPAIQKSSLIALDQMEGGDLRAEEVTSLLSTSDAALHETAMGVVASHPEWADEVFESLQTSLAQSDRTEIQRAALEGALFAFRDHEKTQGLLAETLRDPDSATETVEIILQSLSRGKLASAPEVYREPLRDRVMDESDIVRLLAIATLGNLEVDWADDLLLEIGAHCCSSIDVRADALEVVLRRAESVQKESFDLLISHFQEGVPALSKLKACRVLGFAPLSADQLVEVAEKIDALSPLDLPALLPAFEKSSDDRVGAALAKALSDFAGLKSISSETLIAIADNFSGDAGLRIVELADRSSEGREDRAKIFSDLQPHVIAGDPIKGQVLFYSEKAACSVCHRVQDLGGEIGPNLTHIGGIRSASDFIESILFPNDSLAQGFEPFQISTYDGDLHSGVIRRDTPDAVYLATATGEGIRIEREDIEEIHPSDVSIMPQGLDQVMAPREMGDLVAYLRTLQ